MGMTEVAKAPPGWYDDVSPGLLRWWDGSQWTEQRSAKPVAKVSNGLAVTSLVLGIVGFCLSLTIIGLVVAIPLALLGFILGAVGIRVGVRTGVGQGVAWWGAILCGLPFLLWGYGVVTQGLAG